MVVRVLLRGNQSVVALAFHSECAKPRSESALVCCRAMLLCRGEGALPRLAAERG